MYHIENGSICPPYYGEYPGPINYPQPKPCPTCGTCPTCGNKNSVIYPWVHDPITPNLNPITPNIWKFGEWTGPASSLNSINQ